MSGLLAQYTTLGETEGAIRRLREAGHTDLEVWSPVPAPGLEEAMDIHGSPVGRWALIGGMTGCITGLLLTAGTSLGYPMVTQGKPIVSIPPFIVVMFELTILLTGIFALMAMLVHARRPQLELSAYYRPEFSVDRFGVFVSVDEWSRSEVEQLVRDAGAVKVETDL
jgi:hypothetical protein